eukprot:jgi/Mesen1/6627/ME000034S06083
MHRRSLLDLPLEVARNETSDQEEGDASNSVGNYVDGLTVVYRGLSSWFHKLGRGKSDQECSCSTLSEHIGTLAAGVRPICKQQIKKRGRSAELELAGEIYAANVKERNELMPDLESVKRSNPQMAAALERKLLEEQVMSFYGTPLYPCLGEERLGSWGEGGKPALVEAVLLLLCMSKRPFDLNEHSVVYSLNDPNMVVEFLRVMEELGYLLFHVEQNWLCWTCVELAYIHRSLLVLP